MHNAIRPLKNASTHFQPRLSCRYISGRRHLLPRRNFHTKPSRQDAPPNINEESSESTNDLGTIDSIKSEDAVPVIDWSKFERVLDQGKTLLNDADKHWPGITAVSGESIPSSLRDSWRQNTDTKSRPETRRSWRNRASRHPLQDDTLSLAKSIRWSPAEVDVYSLEIPRWFLERNVELYTDMTDVADLVCVDSDDPLTDPDDAEHVTSEKHTSDQDGTAKNEADDRHNLKSLHIEDVPLSTPPEARYKIRRELFHEIQALARAGLRSATSPKQEDASVSRPHLLLQSPKAGGNIFLSHVASKVAKSLEADCIHIDPATISELILDLGIELPERLSNHLKLLGYDAYHLDEDLEVEEETEYDADGNREGSTDFKPFQSIIDSMFRPGNASSTSSSGKSPAYKVSVLVPKSMASSRGSDTLSSSWSSPLSTSTDPPRVTSLDKDLQYRMLMDRFLDSTLAKGLSDSAGQPVNETRRPLMIVIQDYLELQTAKAGSIIMEMLHELVQDRRTAGQEILIVGLSSSEDLFYPAMTVESWQKMETMSGQGSCRTVITLPSSADYYTTFEEDDRNRTRLLNIRNLQDMLRRLAWSKEVLGEWCWQPASLFDQSIFMEESGLQKSSFELTVWSAHRLNKVATLALGLVTEERPKVDEALAAEAMRMSANSDAKKFNFFIAHEKSSAQKEPDTVVDPKADGQLIISKIRKNANSHEKRLLHGVIDKKDIKTKFSSVHAPESTIKSLKTLTSLSLHRPDAFGYGVLANDKIPGLLLYGPPGTGKTLLAKAVAGESGATVLEVSGSDIYDMYVGEGEKNVRAIFTLAEKLSPCVVFIDEADAILGSRSSPGNRTTHRELINQFLREWDGFSSKNNSAFIMVATNRPFDLDDAVLRRLPRRLLVDLPTEKDREAILRIHLANENLDESVSIESLAQRTPYYSGSDLKNVCVAAALQAVQEEYDAKVAFENEQVGKETPETYTYPQVRTLTLPHFDKALVDISASISEDMSSLTAIRKFDEKYGDHRGRKAKGGLGFGMKSNADAERERREDGRVRREVSVGA